MSMISNLYWKFRYNLSRDDFWVKGYKFIYLLPADMENYKVYQDYLIHKKEGRDNGLNPPSSMFFREGYYEEYPDIKEAGIDAWQHYVLKGKQEGRDNGLNPPETLFSAKGYLTIYQDVKDSGVDPWHHYILYGKKEGRSSGISAEKVNKLSLDLLFNCYFCSKVNYPKIDIILPIYNGFEYLENLFYSIRKNTDIPYHLFIINDASPDKRVHEFIKFSFENDKNVTIITNNSNLGFVKSVNKGLALSSHDVVLVNSDVILPSKWASRIMYPIVIDRNVASVTPFSNAATLYSIPEIDVNNLLKVDLESYNREIENLNVPFYDFHFQTGVGFCMAMSRKAIEKIGFLDEIFEKGYGEENDWCQRAILKGFYNTVAGNLFVWHKHGGSFSSKDKQFLISQNSKIINNRYKDYSKKVISDFYNSVYLSLRFVLIAKYLKLKYKKTIVVFDHSWGGGTETYTLNEVEKRRKDDFIIRVQCVGSYAYLITLYDEEKCYKIRYTNDKDLFCFVSFINPQEVIINNLAGYDTISFIGEIIKTIESNNSLKCIYKMHDLQCVCPSINMIAANGYYCNNNGIRENCSFCKNQNNFPILCASIQQYQQIYKLLIENYIDRIDVFSQSTFNIVKSWFNIADGKIRLIPHTVNPIRKVIIDKHDRINIGIIGNIGISKGINVLKAIDSLLAREPSRYNVKLYVIGNTCESLNNINVLGSYELDKLPNILEQLKIDVILFPSVWPETFSYVVSEVIMMDLPICCFPLGAQAEKVEKYEKGFIIDSQEPTEILDFICKVL